jgi:hypothetical protein
VGSVKSEAVGCNPSDGDRLLLGLGCVGRCNLPCDGIESRAMNGRLNLCTIYLKR